MLKKWLKRGHIYFISGVSWAWKWTLIENILKSNIDNLELALSCKTRELRKWEVSWVDYNKLSIEEFKDAIDSWEFFEYNFVHNQNYYWTRKKDVVENWINKWKNIIKEMDIRILPKVLEEHKDLREYFSYIFLDIPIDEIKNRLITRWDDVSWDDYDNRVISAQKERDLIDLADYVIDATQSPEHVLEQFKKILLG